MADELQVTGDLANRFGQLHEIQDVAARLRAKLDQINTANRDAAGSDDQYATAYHENVDESTQDLVQLVDGVGGLFGTTGTNGQAVSRTFDEVDDSATTAARHL